MYVESFLGGQIRQGARKQSDYFQSFHDRLRDKCPGASGILGFGTYPTESGATWTDFLLGLKKRGLRGVLMITSDAHEGIFNGIGKVFPTVPWLRCQFHFSRNITDQAPKKYQAGIRAELQEMFNCRSLAEVHKILDRIIPDGKNVQ